MLPKPEIVERIESAANALLHEGNETPTNDQVRERLGGGSLSHISPVMRAWRLKRQAQAQAAMEMPEALKKSVNQALSELWISASHLAKTQAENTEKQALDQAQSAEHELQESLTEIARLEIQLEQLRTTLQAQEEQQTQFQQEIQHLKADRNTLQARLRDRDAHIRELKEEHQIAREEVKTLQQELVAIAKGTTPQR